MILLYYVHNNWCCDIYIRISTIGQHKGRYWVCDEHQFYQIVESSMPMVVLNYSHWNIETSTNCPAFFTGDLNFLGWKWPYILMQITVKYVPKGSFEFTRPPWVNWQISSLIGTKGIMWTNIFTHTHIYIEREYTYRESIYIYIYIYIYIIN